MMAPWVWKLAALAGAAAGVAFLTATTASVREGLWLLTLSAVFVATLGAVRRSQPGRRYPWWLIAGCQGLLVLANLLANPLWASPAAWFFVCAAVMGLLGNVLRTVLLANGTYERGTPSDLLILAAHVLIGVASLHPSAPLLTQPADQCRRQFTVARLAVLGVALVAIPLTLLARGVAVAPAPTLVGAVLVSLLVLWRLSRLAIERQEALEQLRLAASQDALTGLPNRRLLLDRLEQALARQARDHRPVAVLFVDLDGFKRVNDDCGHHVGDQLLRQVARRLEELVRRSDTVGRLAGDEFGLICEVTDDRAARSLAERIAVTLSHPYEVEGRPIRIAARSGRRSRSTTGRWRSTRPAVARWSAISGRPWRVMSCGWPTSRCGDSTARG